MAIEKKKAESPQGSKKPKVKKEVAAANTVAAANSVKTQAVKSSHGRRILEGVVVSDKMKKTIVVKVDRRVRDLMYKKYIVRSRRFKAHDEKNEAKVGDLVTIIESKPMSREKRWALVKIVRRSGQAPEANV